MKRFTLYIYMGSLLYLTYHNLSYQQARTKSQSYTEYSIVEESHGNV